MTHCKPAFDHTKAGKEKKWCHMASARALHKHQFFCTIGNEVNFCPDNAKPRTKFMVTPNGRQHVFTEIYMHRNIHVIRYTVTKDTMHILKETAHGHPVCIKICKGNSQ